MVKFLSLNVRGLREDRNRKEMFTFLPNKAFDIIFIQESHSSSEIEKKWQDEWGGIIQYSHYNSRARGTMTLFKKDIDILHHSTDNHGRIDIKYKIVKIDGKKFTCINIYAPNVDSKRKAFFEELSVHMMTHFDNSDVIMAGDFNTTLEKKTIKDLVLKFTKHQQTR